MTRPTMHFVPVKSVDQQAALMLSHLAEFGIVAAQGPVGVKAAIERFQAEQDKLPELVRSAIRRLVGQIEKEIVIWCRTNAASRRLITIPGSGPIKASVISAAVPDPTLFRSGRHFAAWLGLTPRPHSSGGKERLGGISKQGDGDIRRLLVVGASQFSVEHNRKHPEEPGRSSYCCANQPMLCPWPWPTRWPGSPGRCWQLGRSTKLPPCRRDPPVRRATSGERG